MIETRKHQFCSEEKQTGFVGGMMNARITNSDDIIIIISVTVDHAVRISHSSLADWSNDEARRQREHV